MNGTNIENALRTAAEEFEKAFAKYFEHKDADLKIVSDAMRYSALAGGKRIRPFIVNEFCKLFGGDVSASMSLSCALECVHTYSLIHDDLPCMDNDDLRRGKPTCHKVYGEEFALLAGDALLTYAFEIIANAKALSDSAKIHAVKLLSSLSGVEGMVGGQTIDLESEGKSIGIDKLIKLHLLKTGALIRCAAKLGVIAAGADENALESADKYGEALGLAFQITDDILDATADESELGKPVGSDKENGKVTFITFMSVEEAYTEAKRYADMAREAIGLYEKSQMLTELSEYVVKRNK